MRKTGSGAVNRAPKGAPKGPQGAVVDALLERIRARIRELEELEKALTHRGCILAHAHFKTGTRKMYLLSPSENGSRKFTYIGVDLEKQEKARADIDRYEKREGVRRRIRTMNGELDAALRDLGELQTDCARILTMEGSDPAGIFQFGDRARQRTG